MRALRGFPTRTLNSFYSLCSSQKAAPGAAATNGRPRRAESKDETHLSRRDAQDELDLSHDFDRKVAPYLCRHGVSVDRRGFARLAAASSAAVWACPGADAQAGTTTFAFALDGDAASLEPALAYASTCLPVVCQIAEGLLMFDQEGALLPLLAEQWDHPDPLTYIYAYRNLPMKAKTSAVSIR